MSSLRARLLAMLLAATSLIWLAAAAWSYLGARHEAEELLDAQLAQSARLLLAQTHHELVDREEDYHGEFEALEGLELHPYEQKLLFRILDKQGRILLVSALPPPAMNGHATGYADIHDKGQGWRVLAFSDEVLRVEVAQSLSIRDELAGFVALRLALPLLLALPVLGVLIYLVVGQALRPLNELAGGVSRRGSSNLSPVETEGLPKEVMPLAQALNKLLQRLGLALEGERRFTADAAHELRTPLAAVQIQAQVALASREEQGRSHALEQVLAGTRRATRLVEQLLRLARLDPMDVLAQQQDIPAESLLLQTLEDAGPEQRRVDLEIHDDPTLRGDPDLLRVALRNLLDNALRYTPGERRVSLIADLCNGAPRIRVADCGPGVPEAELPRLIERFYRGRETTQDGSGLGLAIVARIAALHGATLHLENRPEGGLLASLGFPPG